MINSPMEVIASVRPSKNLYQDCLIWFSSQWAKKKAF